jgi:hypothetical protein
MDTNGVATASANMQVTKFENAVPAIMSATDIKAQVNLIQDVMKTVMKDGEHYGVIPGCGAKPALLKAGAEKLSLTFRLSPRFEIQKVEMAGGHVNFQITCNIFNIQTEQFLGSGVGSCSTMESKYRFRTGPGESTGKPVPREYWDTRKENPAGAQALIGGRGHTTKKDENGTWMIFRQGERVEHDNPADFYNTVLKMAKKRAHVDAILTVTAASDIFAQDIEENPELFGGSAPTQAQPVHHEDVSTEQPAGMRESAPPPTEEPRKSSAQEPTHPFDPNYGMSKDGEPDQGLGENEFFDFINKVDITDGKKKNGEPWKRYSVFTVGNGILSTFDPIAGDIAQAAVKNRSKVHIAWSKNGNFKNLETIRHAHNSTPSANAAEDNTGF